MNRSLTICMFLSMLTGGGAAALAVTAGWGWLAGLGLYSAIGSTSLVGFAIAAQQTAPKPARVLAAKSLADKPAYA